MKTSNYRKRWNWSRLASSPLVFLGIVIVLAGGLWASGIVDSCWFGIDCPPSTEGLVAIPMSAKTIPAYTKLTRDNAWNTQRGRISVVWLAPEQVTPSMKTDLKDILGRVLARDKAPGYVFTDRDFLPKGSRPGLVGGIPPGKRAVRVVAGQVDGHDVRVGGTAYVAAYTGSYVEEEQAPGAVLVAVAVDGKDVGHLIMADMLRHGTASLLDGLRDNGINRIVLATGDRRAVAEAVTEGLNLDALQTDLTPERKVQLVLEERQAGPVMMVGDGVNDAPALAAANVGVAMGARGGILRNSILMRTTDTARLRSPSGRPCAAARAIRQGRVPPAQTKTPAEARRFPGCTAEFRLKFRHEAS